MNPSDPQGDLLQPKPDPDPMAVAYALQQQVQELRLLFIATFVALIVLGMGVDIFLFKQLSMVQRQLSDTRPQVARMSAQFRGEREPHVKTFLTQLQAFAAQNRDFQPVLDKYRILLPQYLGAPVPAMPGPARPPPAARPPGPPPKK